MLKKSDKINHDKPEKSASIFLLFASTDARNKEKLKINLQVFFFLFFASTDARNKGKLKKILLSGPIPVGF